MSELETPTRRDEVEDVEPSTLRRILLLSVADDELVTGHRSSHWTGVAPGLEEDLAFSTLAQDEINHADVWYQVLVAGGAEPKASTHGADRTGGDDRDEVDALGLGREPDEYRHAVLCERPPTDFAYTLARHWAYDHFDAVRLGALARSSDDDIAAVARKLQHEERYHLEHADHWFWKLAHGGDTAREHLRGGLVQVLPEALWLFEPLPYEDRIVAAELMPAFNAQLLHEWLEVAGAMLDQADLADVLPSEVDRSGEDAPLPSSFFNEPGGRRGVHTPDFTDDVWPEMTHLHRTFPGATW